MKTEKQMLAQLKKDLKGEMAEAVRVTGLSKASVSRILNGEQKNDEMFEKLIDLRNSIVRGREKTIQKLRNKIYP